MVAIRALHLLPPLYGHTRHVHVMLRLGVTLRSSISLRVLAEPLLGFRQLLASVSDMNAPGTSGVPGGMNAPMSTFVVTPTLAE